MFTFSLFMILMAFIVGAIAFFHYTQGLFSGIISAICAAFSAVLALSYHEMVVEKLLGGQFADGANGAVVIAMFAAIYLVLRTVFDQLVPGGVQLPAMADKVGGAVMGLVAGGFAAGVAAFAAQSLPFNPSIMGYSRMEVEESTAGIRVNSKTRTYPLYDAMMNDKPLHTTDSTAQQKMFLPVDDVLVGTTQMLSERGALSTDKPLSSIHPDWLMELFGQRLGVQTAAKRVLMNPPDGGPGDVTISADEGHLGAGVYYLEPGKTLFQQPGEISALTKISVPQGERFGKSLGRGEIAVVVRVFFGKKAKDNRDSLIRLSMGAVRICAQKVNPDNPDEKVWTNYFPVGTLEPSNESVPPTSDERFSVYLQRPDDYLFIDDGSQGDAKVGWDAPAEAKLAGVDKRKGGGPPPERFVEGVADKGVDLVFRVEAKGFLAGGADPKSDPIADGTFLEVKRLARIDLADEKLRKMKPLKDLPRSAATKLFRRETLKSQLATQGSLLRGIVGTWTAPFTNAKGDGLVATLVVKAGGTLTLTTSSAPGNGNPVPTLSTAGTWKIEKVTAEDAIAVKVKLTTDVGFPKDDLVTLTFNPPDLTVMKYASSTPTFNQLGFERQGPGATPPPAAAAPAPAAPTPAAPPAADPGATPAPAATPPAAAPPAAPAAAANPDPNLKGSDGQDNFKFREFVGVPAGTTSGEVSVAGGTVTVEESKIKALNLPLATRAQLRGTGEPLNRFARPEGTHMLQFECALGEKAATGWEWVATADSIELTDATGKKHKLAGAWAAVGEDGVAGRYSADAPVSFAGFAPPAAKPSLVVLAFNLPEGVEAKELTSANGRIWAASK